MPKTLVRPIQGRMLAGVAAGIANYFHISVLFVRVLWVLSLLPGGVPGFLLYIICWILIPSETNGSVGKVREGEIVDTN